MIIPAATALGQLEERGGPLLVRSPVTVWPLGQASLERVRQICAAANLLMPDRVAASQPGIAGGFDPGLSFFAGDPANPVALLLAREHLGKA